MYEPMVRTWKKLLKESFGAMGFLILGLIITFVGWFLVRFIPKVYKKLVEAIKVYRSRNTNDQESEENVRQEN